MKKIVLNPVTRISGYMEIEAELEDGEVVEARTDGMLFRGFELMLKGRAPMDAVYFSSRICGICSSAHTTAASLALEDAFGVTPQEQGRYMRDITHGCDILQNHIRQFYQFAVPSFVRLPDVSGIFKQDDTDFRLAASVNDEIAKHYFDSLPISRLAHTMLALFGGKAPHNHGIFIGGCTTMATVEKILAMNSMLHTITAFIDSTMIPDAEILAEHYSDYFELGKGYPHLLTYGLFNNYEIGTLYVEPSVYINGETLPFNPLGITENTQYAFYEPPIEYTPFEVISKPDSKKADAYTWVKAPRYYGLPFEVGPVARMWLSGEYKNGISTMSRIMARVFETKKIAGVLKKLISNLVPEVPLQSAYKVPKQARGVGLVDTTRGALGHWLEIEDGAISLYQIITPSAWNLSPRTNDVRGPAEHAMLGTKVKKPEQPIELARIILSYDPCVSCATHVYQNGKRLSALKVQ